MAYDPENNPYIPGDPACYDLKWIIDQLNALKSISENLDTIIATAINSKTLEIVSDIGALKASAVEANTIVLTKGYYASGDNGAAFYYIAESTASGNDGNIIALDNGKRALFLPIGEINTSQFGCKGAQGDYQQFQKMIEFASDNNLQICVDAVDLTGGNIDMSFRGINAPDSISDYSRNALIFKGVNRGIIYKNDAGYFFTSTTGCRDLTFIGIKFEGRPAVPDDMSSNVAAIVFNMSKLINVTTSYCTFCWLDTVYTADANDLVQGIFSSNNIYSHNKCIAKLANTWTAHFINDLIEDGIYAIIDTGTLGELIRNLLIKNCTIEGFSEYPPIKLDSATVQTVIDGNYFEGNKGHIAIPRRINGAITGNYFSGRASLPASDIISCIDITLSTNDALRIDNNFSVETNTNTTLIHINTGSPYYNANIRVFGSNKTEGATLSNIPSAVIDPNAKFKNYNIDAYQDITSLMQQTYLQITGGSITLTQLNDLIIVTLNNLAVSTTIGSGTCDLSSVITGTPRYGSGVITNGFGYITTSKGLGLRCSAGTINGQIITTIT